MILRVGWLAVVVGLALGATAGAASAALPVGNLLANPGAEAAAGATDQSTQVAIPDWAATTTFTAIAYDSGGGFPTAEEATRIAGGANFFAGGTDSAVATGTQEVDVSGAAAEIDAGVSATLSALLGGFDTQEDFATVTAAFLGATGNDLGGATTIGPVTAADRQSLTRLEPRTATVAVPAGTRKIRVTITATRIDGSYNDGYADNISLTLGAQLPGVTPVTPNRVALPAEPYPVMPPCVNQKKVIGVALVAGCFRTSGRTLVAVGTVLVNGLVLLAKQGTGDLIFDPARLRVVGSKATTSADVFLPNPLNPGLALVGVSVPQLLQLGSLQPLRLSSGVSILMGLDPALGVVSLAQIVVRPALTLVRGVVLKTHMIVRAAGQRTLQLVAAAAAPNYLGGLSGDLDIRVSPSSVTGRFKLPGAFLGPPGSPAGRIGVEDVDLAFDASKAGLSWDGSAKLVFGNYRLAGHLSFEEGGLGTLRVDSSVGIAGQQPLITAVLNGYALTNTDWLINGTGQITLTNPGTPQLISAQGTLQLSGDGKAVVLRGTAATLRVFTDGLVLGGGSFEMSSAGSLALQGSASLGTATAGISAQFAGWASMKPQAAFNLEGSGAVHVLDQYLSGTALVSSTGYGACASMKITVLGKTVGTARVGFGKRWGKPLDIFASSCDLGAYRATAAGHTAGAGRQIELPAGLPVAVLAVRGSSGSPRVQLTDPKGKTFIPESGKTIPAGGAVSFTDPSTSTQYLLLAKPAAGRWTVTEAPGSPTIAALRVADGLPAPSVRAHVSGRAQQRSLRWNIKQIPGQVVRFVESGVSGQRQIGSTSRPQGSIAFVPAPGTGIRKIRAIIEQDGVPRLSVPVTSYTATTRVLGAPTRLTLRRHGTGVNIRWTPVTGATRYSVRVTTDGHSLDRLVTTLSTSLQSVGNHRGLVTVRALDATGRGGSARAAAFAATRRAMKCAPRPRRPCR